MSNGSAQRVGSQPLTPAVAGDCAGDSVLPSAAMISWTTSSGRDLLR
jgi:hypothetical protein